MYTKPFTMQSHKESKDSKTKGAPPIFGAGKAFTEVNKS
jgi:hypothetical protein